MYNLNIFIGRDIRYYIFYIQILGRKNIIYYWQYISFRTIHVNVIVSK